MTVSSSTSRVGYTGNGVTTAFAVPFFFLENGDLVVYVNGVLQALTTNYTLSGAGSEAGGTCTFVLAPASAAEVVIYRDPTIVQTTDFPPNDRLPSASLERALDRLTMISQRLKDLVSRALRLPDDYSGSASTLLELPVAGRLIGWNATGTGLENYDFEDLTNLIAFSNWAYVKATGDGVTTVFNLGASPGTAANLDVSVGGVTQVPVDDFSLSGGTVTFVEAPPSGVSILFRFGTAVSQGLVVNQAQVGDALYPRTAGEIAAAVTPSAYYYPPGDVRRYGATDGGSNSTAAFASAEAANSEVIVPAGTWNIDTFVTTKAGVRIRTAGFKTIIQQRTGTGNTIPVIQIKHSDCVLDPVYVKGNISTDTLEFKHAVMVYNSSGSIQNVTVGDLLAENIRGDALYIGAPLGQTTRHVTFGRVIGKNVLRNVVAIVGASYVRGEAAIVDTACGYSAFDVEPDNVASSDIYIGYVYGGVLQVAPPTSALAARRIHVGHADLNPAYQANSTPTYSGYSVADAVRLRNCIDVRFDHLKITNHAGLGVSYIWNVGEQKGEAISIGYLNASGVGASEATYNALMQVINVQSITINDGDVSLQAVGDYMIYGDNAAKNTRVNIDRLRIDGTVVRFCKNSRFSNITINTTNAAYAFRDMDDSVVMSSDITIPNFLQTCARPVIVACSVTCSGTYFNGVTGAQVFGDTVGSQLYGSATYDPANLVDGAGVTTTVTVNGAALGNFVDVSFSNDLQGITLTGWVSAANTVSVRFQNETGGALDLASGTLRARVRQH